MANNPTYQYGLFGIYTLELGRFFKGIGTGLQVEPTAPVQNLQVFYGTPRSAFKTSIEKNNGQVILPMLNYYLPDWNRLTGFEHPSWYPTYGTENKTTGRMEVSKAPSRWELNFSINLWTNSFRERDIVLERIVQAFPYSETHLTYFPDATNYPDIYLLMPVRCEMNMTDETDIEGNEMSETRDKIKTTWNMTMTAMLPSKNTEVALVMPYNEITKVGGIYGINHILNKPNGTVVKEYVVERLAE